MTRPSRCLHSTHSSRAMAKKRESVRIEALLDKPTQCYLLSQGQVLRMVRKTEADCRVANAKLVRERREPIGESFVSDLKYVFGVVLAGSREVVAAHKDEVIDDDELRVHVIVDGSWRVRGGDLARERGVCKDRK